MNFNFQPSCFFGVRSFRVRAIPFSALSLSLALAGATGAVGATAQAQATMPTLPPAPNDATATTVVTTTTTTTLTAPQALDPNALLINIDGRVVTSDPAPLLQKGRTFVPLRGVLENLGARVNYVAAEKRVDIARGAQNVTLFLGTTRATVDGKTVEVEKPLLVNGRAFVPLRAVSELFGLRVAWLPATRTVAIYTGAAIMQASNHRSELAAAGPFGVAIDFTQFPVSDIPALLDSAKSAGAGLIKFRFDWGTLEPTKGAAFEWNLFDALVRGARQRDLRVIGILGDTAPWASVATSDYGNDKRQSPPRDAELPSWSNYVTRVVGRYAGDVQAWQVWENPDSVNFRSVERKYRALASLAAKAAHGADASALVYAAEPGGVDLDTVRGYNQNGLTAAVDGITVFPISRFQPYALAAPETFLKPYARLQTTLQVPGKTRDYWVGGLGYPVALAYPGAAPNDEGQSALKLFTPLAQADYLVKSTVLSLAAGSDKVFWGQLRDLPTPAMLAALRVNPPAFANAAAASAVAVVAPGTPPNQTDAPAGAGANVDANVDGPGIATVTSALAAKVSPPREGVVQDEGLQRADGTPRPSFAAYQILTRALRAKPYRGNLSFNSDLVALLFDDRKSGVLVAWSPSGEATLVLNSSGAKVDLPGAQFVGTLPTSTVTDALGNIVAPPDGVLKVGTRPIYISNVDAPTSAAAIANVRAGGLLLQDPAPYENAASVRADLTPGGAEAGIAWRKYANFGSAATNFSTRDGRQGLSTQPQRDIFDLKSQKPFIYFDADDSFLYDSPGVPLTLKVEVYAPPLSDPNKALGFRVEYNSASGNKSTAWQPLVPSSGWQTVEVALPNAQFAGAGGYDFLINVGASAAELTFASVELARGTGAAAP